MTTLAKALMAGLALLAWARAKADPYDPPKVVALEDRAYSTTQDLTVSLGYYPLDAFNKSYTGGLAYSYYFEPHWGWEIANFQWARNQDTGLKRDLIDNFGVQPKGILDYIDWVGTSNLIYTPAYSKSLLFNDQVAYSELSLVGGLGVVHFNSGEKATAFGGGIMDRFYLNQRYSVKVDVRTYYHDAQNKNTNFVLMLNLGLAIQLGGGGSK
jgi:outer membrane beta-barrel protein